MSINPVSDIVLDVAQAADPVNSRAAADKLSGGGAATQASSSDFGHALANATGPLQASQSRIGGIGRSSTPSLPLMDARTKAYKGLEQLILKSLVESMLPKESGVFFGTGIANDIWRSFLADQLATQIGKTVDLGLFYQTGQTPHSFLSREFIRNRFTMRDGASPYAWS